MTADFPGNRRYPSPEPPGEYIARPILKAAQARAKAEVLLWFRLPEALTFTWRVFKGEEWDTRGKRWRGARILVLMGVLHADLDDRHITALGLPAVWTASPAMKNIRHTPLRWLLWHPGQDGYLEMAWDPTEHFIFSLCGLSMRKKHAADRARLMKLAYVPEQPGPKRGQKRRYDTPESYIKAVRDLPKRAKRSGWELQSVPDGQLAEWLAISRNTMTARNEEYGITCDDIREGRV